MGAMREFEWPDPRVWVGSKYYGFEEFVKKQHLLELTKLYETLNGYHGMDLIRKLSINSVK